MKKRNIIRALSFVLVFVLGLCLLDKVFYSTKGVSDVWSVIQEGDEEIDILVMGNSRAYTAIDTVALSQAYGKNVYTLGSGAQFMEMTYENLKVVLKYKKPKYIILEAYSPITNNKADMQSFKIGNMMQNFDGIQNYLYKANAIRKTFKWNTLPEGMFQLFRPTETWTRWNIIENKEWSEDAHGYLERKKYQTSDVSIEELQKANQEAYKYIRYDVPEWNKVALEKFLALAEKEGIEVFVYNAPTKLSDFSAYMKDIEQICEKYENVKSVEDMHFHMVEMGLEETDFYDGGHLNRRGAEKFTEYYGEQISKYVFGGNITPNWDNVFGYKSESVTEQDGQFVYQMDNWSEDCLYQFALYQNGKRVDLQNYSENNTYISPIDVRVTEGYKLYCRMIPKSDQELGAASENKINTIFMDLAPDTIEEITGNTSSSGGRSLLFNSIEFWAVFVLVLLGYYVIPKRMQWAYLLVVSYAYYVFMSVPYTVLLLASTLLTYMVGRFLEKSESISKKKLWMVVCIVLNIGLLVFFKYSQWLLDSLQSLSDRVSFGWTMPELKLLAPVGISFYTFKVVGYLMDVYRGKIESEKNFGKYALFVSFFPQIVSGPIERSYNFLPQMEKGYAFDYDTVKDGFLLFLWGLLKKIVIADRLAILVNQVFDNVASYNTPAYVIAMLFFTMQIYFDFAGYSDMAIGITKMLGISSIKNFDRPYFSKSIGEFWRRWHMSLSTWFRDYLYIPLGGNRVSKMRWTLNVMIVFVTSGLWHGANWTFLVWGALHGIYQVIGKYTRNAKDTLLAKIHLSKKSKIYAVLATVTTFLLTTYAWMFFRANSIGDALNISKALLVWDNTGFDIWNLGMEKTDFIFSVILIVIWFVIEGIQGKVCLQTWLQKRKLVVRWAFYLVMIYLCIMFGIYGNLSASSFIYFQF